MEAYIEFDVFGVMVRYYDDERIERVMCAGKWKTMKQFNDRGYKLITIRGNKKVKVHRVVFKAHNLSWNITDTSKLNQIDHIDRVRNNNKIENLQVATAQQNQFNKNAKGYSYNKRDNKYQAQIVRDGKQIYLGYFDKEDDAREAYLKAKLIYHI